MTMAEKQQWADRAWATMTLTLYCGNLTPTTPHTLLIALAIRILKNCQKKSSFVLLFFGERWRFDQKASFLSICLASQRKKEKSQCNGLQLGETFIAKLKYFPKSNVCWCHHVPIQFHSITNSCPVTYLTIDTIDYVFQYQTHIHTSSVARGITQCPPIFLHCGCSCNRHRCTLWGSPSKER